VNDHITTDQAYDTLDLLRRSVEDLVTIRRLLRRSRKESKNVDVGKATEALSDCLADIIESCAHLSQGDDEDRIELGKELAARIVDEDSK
jgi:hypothetical protein